MVRLDIEAAVRDGIDRTLDDAGLTLAAAVFVLSSLNGIAAGAAQTWGGARMGIPTGMTQTPYHFPIGLPPVITGGVSLLAAIASAVVAIAAIRVFVEEPPVEITDEYFTRDMVWAWLNFVVGWIVFGIVVGIGFVLLVVPGVFLLVTLVFWTVFVAVENENFVDGFRSSWSLVRGHRWRLVGLGFVVLVISLVVSAVFGGVGLLIGGVIGLLIVQVGSALTTTFTTATLARAYVQLTASATDNTETTA